MNLPTVLLLLLSAFPSVQVGMPRPRALEALKADGLTVCDTTTLEQPDALLGGATSGLVACKACPCERQRAAVLVWFDARGRVCSVSISEHGT